MFYRKQIIKGSYDKIYEKRKTKQNLVGETHLKNMKKKKKESLSESNSL